MDKFTTITPVIYWLLIIMWGFIFIFYLNRLIRTKNMDQLIRLLLIILAIDSFRTWFESAFFGLWYTSLAGLLPAYVNDFLTQPKIVFIPKIINLLTSLLIVFFLIKKWFPAEISRNLKMKQLIASKTNKLEIINKELLENKQLLDQAQSMANIGHWELNIETRKFYYSNEANRILGKDSNKNNVIFNSFIALIHDDDKQLVEGKFSEVIEHKKSISIVFRIILEDSNVKTVEMNIKPRFNTLNEVNSLVGMLWDITNQKKNEQEFQDYKEMLENKIQKRTIELEEKNKELIEKNKELEKFNTIFIDREFRVKELKDQIKKHENK